MSEVVKAVILYSPLPKSESNSSDAEETPNSANAERVQKLKDTIDSCSWLIVVIAGGQVLQLHQIAISYALEKADAGAGTAINIFVKDEPESDPSIVELATRLEHDPRLTWQRYTDDDDLEVKLAVLGEVGKQALIKVFRARSVILFERELPEESAHLRIRVIRLTTDDPVSKQKWRDYIFLHFRLQKLEEYVPAKEAASAALELAQMLEDADLIGRSYLQIGYCCHQLGELKEAEQAILCSIQFGKQAGDESVLGGRYRRLGMIYRSASRLEAAEQCFLDALVIETKLGDKDNAAATCRLLSSLSQRSGA